MSQSITTRITAETVRQLAATADIRPDEVQLSQLAESLNLILAAIERCEALNLAEYEPAGKFELKARPDDGQR